MKKIILVISLFILIPFGTMAQTEFNLPENIELNKKSDYSKYENEVIQAAKWLEETDLDKEVEKRKQIQTFVVKWVSGSPDITLEINAGLMDLFNDSGELMALYFASYSRYLLENKEATASSATKAGIISMINVYKKGIGVKKNSEMKRAIKFNDQNKLEDYIAQNLK